MLWWCPHTIWATPVGRHPSSTVQCWHVYLHQKATRRTEGGLEGSQRCGTQRMPCRDRASDDNAPLAPCVTLLRHLPTYIRDVIFKIIVPKFQWSVPPFSAGFGDNCRLCMRGHMNGLHFNHYIFQLCTDASHRCKPRNCWHVSAGAPIT